MSYPLFERDREIMAAYRAGESRAELAARYGLSHWTICAIIKKNRGPGRLRGQKVGPYKQDQTTYLCSRIRYLPTQIANLEAKLAAVKAEARSYGLVV